MPTGLTAKIYEGEETSLRVCTDVRGTTVAMPHCDRQGQQADADGQGSGDKARAV